MTEEITRESELALGHYLTFRRPPTDQPPPGVDLSPPTSDGWTELRFQNFWIRETGYWDGQPYLFLPFGFSGISVNRSGDNVDTSLLFPKNTLSMAFSDFAIREQWAAVVRVVWVQNLTSATVQPTLLHQYEGQVVSGKWDDTTISLTCNSVLDAVASDVPARSLQQQLVGNVPFTGQLSLQ